MNQNGSIIQKTSCGVAMNWASGWQEPIRDQALLDVANCTGAMVKIDVSTLLRGRHDHLGKAVPFA